MHPTPNQRSREGTGPRFAYKQVNLVSTGESRIFPRFLREQPQTLAPSFTEHVPPAWFHRFYHFHDNNYLKELSVLLRLVLAVRRYRTWMEMETSRDVQTPKPRACRISYPCVFSVVEIKSSLL